MSDSLCSRLAQWKTICLLTWTSPREQDYETRRNLVVEQLGVDQYRYAVPTTTDSMRGTNPPPLMKWATRAREYSTPPFLGELTNRNVAGIASDELRPDGVIWQTLSYSHISENSHGY